MLQFTYSTGSTDAAILGWPIPLTDAQPLPLPPWQQNLKESALLFTEENSLQHQAMTRVYGIGTSPLGDLVAVNSSTHPSDSVEYIIASDQISTLNIASAKGAADYEILPASGGSSYPYGEEDLKKTRMQRLIFHAEISAESILFSLKRFIERIPQSSLIDSMFQTSALQAQDLTAQPDLSQLEMPITEETSVRSIVRQMRRGILFHKESIADRNKSLTRFAIKGIPQNPPIESSIVRRIATEVVHMPHFISEASDISQRITHIHCVILEKLDARDGRVATSDGVNDQEVETCEICAGSIAFESLRWARCRNAHQFRK